MRNYLIASFIIVAGCGGKPSTGTTPPTAPGGVLEVGEITMFDGPNAMFKIHANGTTEMGSHKGSMKIEPGKTASSDSLPIVWEPGPTIHTDGTIDAKGGPVAKVNADGTIVELKTNTTLPVTVSDDKVTITDKGTAVSAQLGADGKLTFINAPDRSKDIQVHIEGADTAGKRRTVLVMLGVMFAPGKMKVESSTPTTNEVVPVEPMKN